MSVITFQQLDISDLNKTKEIESIIGITIDKKDDDSNELLQDAENSTILTEVNGMANKGDKKAKPLSVRRFHTIDGFYIPFPYSNSMPGMLL